MKALLTFLFTLSLVYAQTRDSIVTTTVTQNVCHDSTYLKVDTFKVAIPVTVSDTLKGIYAHPDELVIGNSLSEGAFLIWAKRQGANMLNLYARSYLYTDATRTQLALFVKKAKEQGFVLVTVDVRLTNASELPDSVA